jgi:hypothetical protein
MSLTTMDALVAAMIPAPQWWGKDATTAKAAGIPHTPWYATGVIGAGAAPTGALNGATLSGPTLAGQIPIPPAVAGATSVLLRASAQQAGNIGGIWVVDRQWGNVPVMTTLPNQPIASPVWVARDASASTSGAGVYLAMECSVATGNAGAITNTTVSYTNSDGVAGRTATLSSWPITAPVGTFVPFSLQAGDDGVRSVQGVVLGTSYISGQAHLVSFRPIAELAVPLANTLSVASLTQLGRPSIWDASVLQLVYFPTGTACGAAFGSLSYAQG